MSSRVHFELLSSSLALCPHLQVLCATGDHQSLLCRVYVSILITPPKLPSLPCTACYKLNSLPFEVLPAAAEAQVGMLSHRNANSSCNWLIRGEGHQQQSRGRAGQSWPAANNSHYVNPHSLTMTSTTELQKLNLIILKSFPAIELTLDTATLTIPIASPTTFPEHICTRYNKNRQA